MKGAETGPCLKRTNGGGRLEATCRKDNLRKKGNEQVDEADVHRRERTETFTTGRGHFQDLGKAGSRSRKKKKSMLKEGKKESRDELYLPTWKEKREMKHKSRHQKF